ncbi:Pre-mRNA-splicing factor cwc26 [Apophysomyces ossiformis]|uniref:Pre-mRNA-splicing factor cwc26 n=1 Tax=Apophysomyces ossiformis TaxID=679940 RepID=A0A8H7EV16_9FUNG|nr:Pre-mRNA-splicing factor cwc26 [Apophysomyces ossiformis]
MEQAEREEIFRQKYLVKGSGDEATKKYIADKYLSGGDDGKKKKKKKSSAKKIRKGNIGIVDEDEWGWKPMKDPYGEDELIAKKRRDESLEAEAATNSKGVFRGRTDGWEVVQEGVTQQGYVEEEEAEDEKPVVVAETVEEKGDRGAGEKEMRMSSGQKAGLLTKEEIRQEAERAREREREEMMRLRDTRKEESVYRDVTGRKYDPKIKRAEEARAKKEAIEREERRMEWGKGLVQRNEVEAEKQRLKEEKDKPLARYADDVEYNEQLKEQHRWADPAASFLTKKSSKKGKDKGPSRPTYKGPWKPNRFMIPPGYRWDGVDRSNGYEDEFLLRQNQQKSRAREAHGYATEDM